MAGLNFRFIGFLEQDIQNVEVLGVSLTDKRF